LVNNYKDANTLISPLGVGYMWKGRGQGGRKHTLFSRLMEYEKKS